jgi:hypothetical protein
MRLQVSSRTSKISTRTELERHREEEELAKHTKKRLQDRIRTNTALRIRDYIHTALNYTVVNENSSQD